jgi:hypothetical protein
MHLALICHPETPCPAITHIDVTLGADGQCRFVATGNIDAILLPNTAPPVQTDNLWQTTCFEAFVKPDSDTSYREYNFSPSGAWAAYDFDGYRQGMRLATAAAPAIMTSTLQDQLTLAASLELALDRDLQIGLSAVIEDVSGTKSYWALAHPPGRPDFHHSDCFAFKLAASQRA